MNYYLPTEEKIRILGRTKVQSPLPLFWTGSGVEFVVNGSELTFVLTTDFDQYEQWIRVEVDGYSMLRMPLRKGENRVTVYRKLNKDEKRHVRLLKEVQAMPEDPEAMLLLEGIETDGEFFQLPSYDMKIEFIGDSLTSGEGLAGAIRLNDWVSCVFSTKESYTQTIGKELNAEVRVISQSGWGAYCSWDHIIKCALPLYYEQVCGVLRGDRNEKLGAMDAYDFSTWQPDVVYVNLGSNDRSGLSEHPEEGPAAFSRAMYDFLVMIRKNNPSAEIIWACGLGKNELSDTAAETLSRFVADTGDGKTHLLELPGTKDFNLHDLSEMLGSRNHPGPKANRYQADYIEKLIKELKK